MTLLGVLNKYAEFFADISMQSFEVQQFEYSLQGLYSVIAAREVLSIKPVWNPQYEKFTGLTQSEVQGKIKTIQGLINESKVMKQLIEFAKKNSNLDSSGEKSAETNFNLTPQSDVSPVSHVSKSPCDDVSPKNELESTEIIFDTASFTHLNEFSANDVKNSQVVGSNAKLVENVSQEKLDEGKDEKTGVLSTRVQSRITINLESLQEKPKKYYAIESKKTSNGRFF